MLVAGILAYFTSLLLPAFIYTHLSFQQVSDIILDIAVIATVGVVVGLESALIVKNKIRAVLTSIIGGVLGVLTPYISNSILQINLPSGLSIVLGRPLFYFTILSSPALAAIISLAYLSIMELKLQPVMEVEERREERKEEIVVEEKEVVEEPVKERGLVEAIREGAEAEVKSTEVPTVAAEPELDIIKELVKEIEEETRTKEEAVLEEAPIAREVTVEELLKKCRHCGEMIPYDSIYCPLCGEYQGEE